MGPFKRLPGKMWITPRHHKIRSRIVGRRELDAYRFHIGLSWFKWPFWTEQIIEAAAMHDFLYETAQGYDEHLRADRVFIEIAARNQLHPAKLLLAWGALRMRAFIHVKFRY